MDFEIPEELKMVQSLVKDFVNDQLKPLERDVLGRAADLSDARMSLPPETEDRLIGMVKDIGLWGVGVPEELGGAGLDTLGNCLVEEELAQTIIPFNLGDVTPILFDCDEAQRAKYFLPVFNREKHAYLALLEPGKGASVSDMGMTARRADGHYVLNGSKLSFSRPAGNRDFFAVVFAATAGGGGREGVSCFLVDGHSGGFGVAGDGERSGWQCQVREPVRLLFEDCAVPAENLVGEEGKAFYLGRKWLPSRRLVRGARCVGVAQRLLEEAAVQAQSWQSYGEFISKRVDIQAALAEIAVGIHACRLMVYEAACSLDGDKAVKRDIAMVKLFATQMIRDVADRVARVFNGAPYTPGLPMERLCRHALSTSSTDLALELQRNVIARDILKGLKV